MSLEAAKIPARAVVEVVSDPTPELLGAHLPAVAALLRLALLGGMELTLSTMLHLVVDICQQVVDCERQLAIFDRVAEGDSQMQAAGHCEGIDLPEIERNALNHAVKRWRKPLLIEPGFGDDLDWVLAQMRARSALVVPLFVGHEPAGSLQVFRSVSTPFTSAEAQLLWIMSLLAENHMVQIHLMTHLTQVAFTDHLTGLKTRGYFEHVLEQEVRRALRRNGSCALLLLDLDDFKHVNDRFGHHAGDAVLRQVGGVLTRDMRDIDTVARYGGDEFAVILPDTDDEGVLFVATRLREAIRHTHFRVPELEGALSLRASIGVAICPSDERQGQALIRAADRALYQAKQQGKDRPFFWSELRRTS